MENKKIKINEIIVVEGRDDITTVKRVIDAHVVALNGFSGLTKKSLGKLSELAKNNDLILLTDPDFAGKKIRSVVEKRIPDIKHAFISRKNATKKDNIGVENASDESIKEALLHIVTHKNKSDEKYIFTVKDLIENGLCSGEGAKEKRVLLGDILKIGYYNSKQLLNALNSFDISKENFDEAIREIEVEYQLCKG